MLTLKREALERRVKAVHVWAKPTNYGLPSRVIRFPGDPQMSVSLGLFLRSVRFSRAQSSEFLT